MSSGGKPANGVSASASSNPISPDSTRRASDRQPGQRSRLVLGELAAGMVAVAGHDDPVHERRQRGSGGRPVERETVAEVGDRPTLEQVAGEDDTGSRHRHHRVVVRVTATEVPKLDRAPSDLDRRFVVEDAVRRIDDDLRQIGGDLRLPGGDRRPAAPRPSSP